MVGGGEESGKGGKRDKKNTSNSTFINSYDLPAKQNTFFCHIQM